MNWSSLAVEISMLAGIYAVLCISLNLQFGYTGMVNFGIVAYFAAGAYTYVLVTQGGPGELDAFKWGFSLPMWAGLLLAGAAGGLFALLTGWPCLRLRDEYLALTTFAFAEVFHSILQNTREVSNGTLGIAGVERPFEELFRPESYRFIFAGLVLAFLLASFLLAQRLGRSPFGRTLMAIRDDELSVGMAGRNVRRYRLQIFVLTAVMAGFAGAFYAWYTTAIHPDVFLADITFVVFIALIIGGVGSNRGAIIGAFVLISFEEFIRFLALDPSLEYRVSGLRVAMTGLLMAFLLRVRPREGEGPLGEWLARLDWGPLRRKKRGLDALNTEAR